jgi:epoxyqueuosine reductase
MIARTASVHSAIVKQLAREQGFGHCGISIAGNLDEEEPRLRQWLDNNFHGTMAYMAEYFSKRLNPALLVEGAQSVISLIFNYAPAANLFSDGQYKVARYAYGEDYHQVVKENLHKLLNSIREKAGPVKGRVFVDSAPIMERQWAAKAGLGWIGKNTLLLNPKMGSYFFLAEIISDLELEPDMPMNDLCGTCSRCIDACPTGALTPWLLDARKCISYLTIELKGNISEEFRGKYQDWIFGCDICQEVCPWNRFSVANTEPLFEPLLFLKNSSNSGWMEITEDAFKKYFAKSPVKRTKYEGLKRNIVFIRK